jgi:hypothetical protein
MKKAFLLLLCLSIFTVSCSSDDDNTSTIDDTFMSTIVNGVLKESNLFGASETVNDEGEIIISISGVLNPSVDGNLSDFIQLNIKQFQTGINATTFENPVIVKFDEVYYRDSDGTFTINITRNDTDLIEGTYSGQIREESNPDSLVEIMDGSFKYVFPN